MPNDLFDLTDKVAIVTGTSRGLAQLCILFLQPLNFRFQIRYNVLCRRILRCIAVLIGIS